jgi:methylmalonyl-CoA/ethylmalonyl-CoA epimerase
MTTEPVLPNLHHVGIVQPDMDAANEFVKLFGYEEDYRGFVESFQCWCIFLKAPAGSTAIELVVPTGGPLARFNKGAGGLHHYALLTDDIVALQKRFEEQGIKMTESKPVKGAGPFLCNFVNPISTRGIIIEYVQLL